MFLLHKRIKMDPTYILHVRIKKYLMKPLHNSVKKSNFLANKIISPITYWYYTILMFFSPNPVLIEICGNYIEFVDPFRVMQDYIENLVESERPVLQDFSEELRENDVVFDIGADLGIYTCVSATRGITTVAFEPLPTRRGKLRANIRQNQCASAVHVKPYALLEAGISDWLKREFPAVETAVGDCLVKNGVVPQPSIMKIDVEGGELSTLKGLKQSMANPACHTIYCELHPAIKGREEVGLSPGELNEVRNILTNAGFDIVDLHIREDHGDQPFIKATK